MKNNLSFITRIAVTAITVSLMLSGYFYVIKPKSISGDGFPTTATYKGFYEMEKNSLDVIFLGSSHGACAFNPKVMDEKGISSYNLSCEQQNLYTSYYWLKEMLKYQQPKAIVIDIYMLYLFDSEELKSYTANGTRKAFDFMKMSPNKIEACFHGTEIDPELTPVSMFFPNVMYHTRWKELSKKDFKLTFSTDEAFSRGFYDLHGSGVEGYTPFDEPDNTKAVMPNKVMLKYLEKILDICEKESIPLILVLTPTSLESEEEYSFISNIPNTLGHNVTILDFNSKEIYSKCNYNFSTDNNDDDHANIYGAEKITNYLADYILSAGLVN